MTSNSEARKRRERPDTITITISREVAERTAADGWVHVVDDEEVATACRIALEDQR